MLPNYGGACLDFGAENKADFALAWPACNGKPWQKFYVDGQMIRGVSMIICTSAWCKQALKLEFKLEPTIQRVSRSTSA